MRIHNLKNNMGEGYFIYKDKWKQGVYFVDANYAFEGEVIWFL